MRSIVITGGAGFIGSHVVRLFLDKYPEHTIVNLDALTYAGNLENLRDVEQRKNYVFEKVDIANQTEVDKLFDKYQPEGVVHLAAESHVDRSIENPSEFVMTNVVGTLNLLNAAKRVWNGQYEGKRFYHISTDEVYGSLGSEGYFTEKTSYSPRSPYSASKASSDHLVRAYFHTYGLPVVLSNCSNNYGPNQFPEKLIPLVINNIKHNRAIPVYGKGENIRDWLFVEDHARAIYTIFSKGTLGETYNIGGSNEWTNIKLIETLCAIMDKKLGRSEGTSKGLIEYVKDRAGHDFRYAIDSSKLQNELGWKPSVDFATGLEHTVTWYLNNTEWMEHVLSGEYEKYYQKQYTNR